MLEILNSLDVKLFQSINLDHSSAAFDSVMQTISGRFVWILPSVLLLLFGLWRKNKAVVSFCLTIGLTLGATDFLTYQVLKPTFHRERPCHQEIEHRLVAEGCGGDWGFPSNHAANGMAIAVSAAWQTRHPLVWLVAALSLAVGYSRIHLGVHFPGDILAGYVCGAFVATLIYWLLRLSLRRWNRETWILRR